jgi:cyclic nucleotide gated channel beta 1
MFIVDKGIIEVVVDGRAVAQMKEGSYFGEISLLSMGEGGNRRTANVVSKGFSNLLVLYKNDLDEVLNNYPGMESLLRKTAEYLILLLLVNKKSFNCHLISTFILYL